MMEIECKSCKRVLPRSEFARDLKKNGHCRECRSHKDRFRRFNITEVEYNGLLEAQDGVCAICYQEETKLVSGRPVSLSVDHDHNCCPGDKSCGKCIRRLLCDRCNMAIGAFEDDIRLLKAAVDYLEEFNDLANTSRRSSRRFGNFVDQVRRFVRKG